MTTDNTTNPSNPAKSHIPEEVAEVVDTILTNIIKDIESKETLVDMIETFKALPEVIQIAVRDKMMSNLSEEEIEDIKTLHKKALDIIQSHPVWKTFVSTVKLIDLPQVAIDDAESIMASHLCNKTIFIGNEDREKKISDAVNSIIKTSMTQFADILVGEINKVISDYK